LKEGQEDIWSTACLETIEATFGEASNHYLTFVGPVHVRVSRGGSDRYDPYAETRDAAAIERRIQVLKTLIEQIDLEIGFEHPVVATDFWADLHPSVTRVARGRFGAKNYADAVEAALKEVNSLIKDHVKRRTGEELDGAPLMFKAFSPNAPLIALGDLTSESGRNIQQGYMQLYTGAMIGIRNPKAHENIVIDGLRAKHFLYLASLLAYRFDERF
jgi:uncharacterized protein (TIGR02391 family)